MNKKTSIKILITIIAVLTFTFLIPSIINNVNAVSMGATNVGIQGSYINNSSNYTGGPATWDTVVSRGEAYISSEFFKNNYVFCIQLGQHLDFTNWPLTYSVKKIEIDGSQSNLANGLAYILHQESDRNNSWDWTNYQNDSIQLALWAYIQRNSGTIGDIIPGASASNIDAKNGYVRVIDTQYGSYTAYDILTKANQIANGTTDKYYSATVYILDHISSSGHVYQSLMLVETTPPPTTPPPPPPPPPTTPDEFKVKLRFKKEDFSGRGLEGAEITVTPQKLIGDTHNVDSISKTKLVSGNNGYFEEIVVTPGLNNGSFYLTIEETKAPDGYTGLTEKVNIHVKYDETTGNVTSVRKMNQKQIDNIPNVEESNPDKTIIIKNEGRSIDLNLIKTDFSGRRLQGAEIDLYMDYEGDGGYNNPIHLTSDNNGIFKIPDTVMTDIIEKSNGYFRIAVNETKAPNGYSKMTQVGVVFCISYDTTTGYITEITSNVDEYTDKSISNDGVGTLILKNKLVVNLILNKRDSLTHAKLAGAKFRIELTNIENILGYDHGSEDGIVTTTIATTDENGQIIINGIVPDELGEDIVATITEIEVPTADGYYYKPIEPITITIKYNNGNYGVTAGASSTGRTISLNIENDPLIDLSGMVWQDGQTGEKVVEAPNGFKEDEENGLNGVMVVLKNANDAGSVVATTRTNTNGEYNFLEIPKTNDGYKILFSYDGINWEETKSVIGVGSGFIIGDSLALEINRQEFNNKFLTITKNYARSKDGKIINLRYNYNSQEKKSTLQVNMDGTNPAQNYAADFRMSAQTKTVFKTTTDNIDCGLVKKELDLAIGTDVKNARLEINDKSTEYTYAQIIDGAMKDLDLDKILENNSSKNEKPTYNLYLYSSDYNYRIDDYKTDDTAIKNNVNPGNPEGGYTEIEGNDNNDTIKELEAYVTYSVILKNQTTHEATVEEFVYYYDSEIYTPTMKANDIIDGYKVKSIKGNKITFESVDNNKLTSNNDYRKEVNLTFSINKNADNSLIIKDNISNVAEISKYSTVEGGLIDKDSQPENCGIGSNTNGIIPKYEDDTDQAKGISISIKEDKVRTITGTVFEDVDKDGKYEVLDSRKKVNDVIVQLIEIKKINGQYYEYIWQETRSGNNQVKTTARNGYTGKTYKNNVTALSGKYEFKDFIPGNYIIRFIYGDGTTYDLTDNVKQYNGQDYKSTKDPNYKQTSYNLSTYSSGASIARDNEARRLEVMAFSTIIDRNMGEVLNILNGDISELSNGQKEILDRYYDLLDKNDVGTALEALNKFKAPEEPTITLDNINDEDKKEYKYKLIKYYVYYKTWMCAETSRINVPVDADDLKTTEDNIVNVSVKDTGISFGNMNFGLSLRPTTQLVLEKHITGLKITPTGIGVQPIIDAKADIAQIINGETVETTGVTKGLATTKSTRDNRGMWKVATDIEELMQGAELEVEYTYVIKNEGEKDYLSKTLVEAYENQDAKPYNDVLREIKETVKGTMRSGTYSYGNNNAIGNYLGQVYYRGLNEDRSVPDTDEEVSSRIETLEEALNNDLALDTTKVTDFIKVNDVAVEKPIYDTNGNITTEAIDTIASNNKATKPLKTGTVDYSKTIKLITTLAALSGEELGANIPSYIAEIVEYSNAAGRRDVSATPRNLSYVHSEDSNKTLNTYYINNEDGSITYYQKIEDRVYKLKSNEDTEYVRVDGLEKIPTGAIPLNEHDEFWGETIIIGKPEGEDKITSLQIAIISISAVAVLGVGILLIKKFVLNK